MNLLDIVAADSSHTAKAIPIPVSPKIQQNNKKININRVTIVSSVHLLQI